MDYQVSLLVKKNTNFSRLQDLSPFKIGRCATDLEINQFISDMQPDVVIHTAGSYGRKGESLVQVFDSNIRFGAVILDAIIRIKKKVSFLNTDSGLSRDVSLYALTKTHFKGLAGYISASSERNIQFINIILQHMYGPGDDISKFTEYVLDACKSNTPTLPLTFGEQKRDFIYIDDVVDAYVKILENIPKLTRNEEIELGSGVPTRLRDFVEIAHRLTNSKTQLLFGQLPYRENEDFYLVANVEFLKKIGWEPKYDLLSGLKMTLEKGVQKDKQKT